MRQGRIKKLVKDRGYGFIRDDDGKELFFHRSQVQTPASFEGLGEEQPVEFDLEESPKGPRAVNVRVSNETAP